MEMNVCLNIGIMVVLIRCSTLGTRQMTFLQTCYISSLRIQPLVLITILLIIGDGTHMTPIQVPLGASIIV